MKSKALSFKRAIAVRLEKGEEVIESLAKTCTEKGVKSGLIFGIGALGKCTLYASRSAEALEPGAKELEEPLEIASATGNVTEKDKTPFIHLHVVLGRADHSSLAGHLKSGTVSLTGEFWILECSGVIPRKRDEILRMDLMGL
jgi:predicted DNA-binding protein with PD1-like motif